MFILVCAYLSLIAIDLYMGTLMPKISNNGLLPRQRHQIILDHLSRDGRVLAAGLASELGVTEDMIRRDLRDLSEAGICQRVYGGAVPLSSESTSIVQRSAEHPEQKNALAKLAISLVTPGQTIFLDGGSTNESIALCLPRNLDLTIVTNAPIIAAALIGRTDLKLLTLGGRVDSKFGAAVGASTVRDIQMIRADLCFLGVCAVDVEGGLAAFDPDEADVKRAFVRSSSAVAIAVMNNKLGTRAPYCVASTTQLSYLIVEQDAPASPVNELADAGVQILRLER
jgi:DeoR/GlpR family transcriptional regulator of sugar metabolism